MEVVAMKDSRAWIFVVDDDESIRETLGDLLRSMDFNVQTFSSAEEFLSNPRRDLASCVILDVQLPDTSGLEVQLVLARWNIRVPIIFITGHGDIPMTVRAMKAGAVEFLSKPFSDEALLNAVEQTIKSSENGLPKKSPPPQHGSGGEPGFAGIVGNSPALRVVLQDVETVARTDSTVLIQGETGTGKELIARAIHKLSLRRSHPFVTLNCAAVPTGLLESELFGHEKGAFTGAILQRIGRFELASKGTIFLDEIGDMPSEIQPKLLRLLQEREFERLGSTRTQRSDARLIAATNLNLATRMENKLFRSDLYYRLNVFPITVPPLRDRNQDIPLLAQHFVQKYAARMDKRIDTIPSTAMQILMDYSWPGNVRELENLMERAVILSSGDQLELDESWLKTKSLKIDTPTLSLGVALVEREKEMIETALAECAGRIAGPSGAANKLGLPRQTLESKIKALGINKNHFRARWHRVTSNDDMRVAD
jgi:DNA-binding NtrC family response regulator